MSTPGADPSQRRRIDRYELHELIGEGGMGAVYRAVDSRLGRTVAVKTVLSRRYEPALNDELRQRFMREALAASRVAHRNVVQVLDFGVSDDGTPYLVMEHLRGRDLGVVLSESRSLLEIGYVADIMLGVCAALRACHQQGIVHRDLKPSNIFLCDTDTGHEVKVLDFGVSKAPVAGNLTQEGQILGTPQYLSPEQVNGRVGPESDQYALGVLLYVCLTNRLPFEEHQNLSLLRAIELSRFPSPRVHRPDISKTLEAIILRAMDANPAARFESVHALGQALWAFASGRGQVEWRNYYLQSRPTPDAEAGIPIARTEQTPPTVDPTAVLAEGANRRRPGADAAGPQLQVSTKLAKPASPTPGVDPLAVQLTPRPTAEVRRRGSAWLAGMVAGLLVVGTGFFLRRYKTAAAPAAGVTASTSVRPPTMGAPTRPEPTRPEPTRPEPTRAAAIAPAAPPRPSPPAAVDVPTRPSSLVGHRAGTSVSRKKRVPGPGKSSKMSGIDGNGIGIPSD